ncbi:MULTISPECIES: hypothetical protein [unclassified Cryobacterium]|uniref:hypothetical protein n=1 Tax=unclassified Cryobacterium TaxID=2649013 RepID=UPI00106DB8F5|nr:MULTISPECIES: hypothetical protein [unclassified Cryobacterium]TFC58935.1 hypothetical protein E3O60_10540 [Cryobacterium sp. TMB1-7]TFC89679.1 hypothetical protein E3T19_07440 [Cryobacterium sp. TMT4-31]
MAIASSRSVRTDPFSATVQPFPSLEAFAATAALQPHELVRLGSEAFCSPRPRAKRGFGRRVDY